MLLAFIAGTLLHRGGGASGVALAQNQPFAGARGVFAFTGQIDTNAWGVFMLDIEQGTLWCYELVNEDGTQKLRLAAARTWLYDRYLRDFNNQPPDFRAVQRLVEQQRKMQAPAIDRGPDQADDSGFDAP